MHTTVSVVSALLAVTVLLAACGGGEATPTPTSDAALVSWVGDFCTAGDTLDRMPPPLPNPGQTTDADRQRVLAFITTGQTTLTSAKRAFDALRDAPTKDGHGLLVKYRTSIDGALADGADLSREAAEFPGSDLESVLVIADVDIGLFNPVTYPAADYGSLSDYVKAYPALAAAYGRARACQT